jgi:arginine exporter protein ArgO
MGEALLQSLPFAIGLILSPFPLIAMVMILSGPRRAVNAPVFALASVLGLLALGAIVLIVSAGYPADDAGDPAAWVSWSRLVLGLALLVIGVGKLRARPWRGEPAEPPRWIRTIDTLTWARAAGLGVVVSVLNPKNLVLALAGAGAIAQVDLATGPELVALVVFVALGTLGITVPLGLSLALGERGVALLRGPKEWMERNNALIVVLLVLIFGVVLTWNGIAGLGVA